MCWSPTARRLVGEGLRGRLEARGARVRMVTESDRGARGRLVRGDDDLAVIAGGATDDETGHGLVSRVLGYHVLVAVVHEQNPMRALPRPLLRAGLIGETTDWQHLGAPAGGSIQVAGVEEGPFSDQATSLVMLGDRLARGWERLPDDDAVCAFVAGNPGALGLCSLVAAQKQGAAVRILMVDQVVPSPAAFQQGAYSYACPIRVVARDASHLAWIENCPEDVLLSAP